MPDAVPTVIALAGASEAATAIVETVVSERRVLRMKSLVGLFFVQATQENCMAVVGNHFTIANLN